ncbi:MAG: hypothetical protein KME30_08300 [Iphinoe sp. HA4291-MV1]|jgi:GH24 family phage-related lysozyme (muramidase)|nr:hypothetical protein [Iphinoe sp. HA4291-MV1]
MMKAKQQEASNLERNTLQFEELSDADLLSVVGGQDGIADFFYNIGISAKNSFLVAFLGSDGKVGEY